jgi:fructose-bisphosphate aldolase class 1
MQAWNGQQDNLMAAQAIANHRAQMNGLAAQGGYAAQMESPA